MVASNLGAVVTPLPLTVVVLPDPLPDTVVVPPDKTPVLATERDVVVTPLPLRVFVLSDPLPDTVVVAPDATPVVCDVDMNVVVLGHLPPRGANVQLPSSTRADGAKLHASSEVHPFAQLLPSPAQIPQLSSDADPPHFLAQSYPTAQLPLQSYNPACNVDVTTINRD